MFDDAAAGAAVATEVTRPRMPRAATSAVLPFLNTAVRRLSPTEPSSPKTQGSPSAYNVGGVNPLVRRITQSREEGVSSRSRRGDGSHAARKGKTPCPKDWPRLSPMSASVHVPDPPTGCHADQVPTPARRRTDHPDRNRRPARNPVAAAPGHVASDTAELLRLQRAAGNAVVSSLFAAPASSAALTIQRYKSYEHVEAGAVESFIGPEETAYAVKRDETPASIARAHSIAAAALLERNKAKVKVWAGAGGREIEGFEAGETIAIPTGKLAMVPPSRTAKVSEAQSKVTIHGVTMLYGEAMAMADYYGSYD